MNKDSIKQSVPLLIILATTLFMIVSLSLSDYVFELPHYIAIIMTGLCTFFFFYNRKFYKYLMFLTLIIGTINMLSFTPSIISIGSSTTHVYSNTTISFSFQPLSFGLLLFFLFINKGSLKSLMIQSEQEKIKERENQKIFWVNKFKDKSIAELERMSSESDYLEKDAKEAVFELLKSKGANKE